MSYLSALVAVLLFLSDCAGSSSSENDIGSTGTPELRPSPPVNVSVQRQKDGLHISWLPPDNSPVPVEHYAIEYRTVGQWVSLTSRLTDPMYTWTNPSYGAEYFFRVTSYSQSSQSESSEIVSIRTGEPLDLTIRPDQELHTKPLGSAMVLTCSMKVGEDFEGKVSWFDGKDTEITQRTGRLYVESDDTGNLLTQKLYITRITGEDAGKYSCQGQIRDTVQKKDVRLQLFEDISFDGFPRTQNPKLGEDALILCGVKGNPKPTVSWRHKGKRIYEGTRYSIVKDRGVTIRNITESDNGIYVCRGEVELDGRYREENITVEVHVPPKITRPLEDLEAIQGDEALFRCEATGLPLPSFEFFKDGSEVPLMSSDDVKFSAEGAGSLSFTSVKKSDEGNYTCKAVNRVGNDSDTAQLKVLVKPSISEFADVVGVKGKASSLVCIANGDPLPSLTFRKEGSSQEYRLDFSDDEHCNVSSAEEGQLRLTLHELRLEDSGKYFCSASSKIGTDEKTANITVQFEPSIVITSEAVYTWAGKVQNLTCEPSGEPAPKTVWTYSDTILANNDTFMIYDLEKKSILQVKVREVDQSWIYGPYTCRATNSLGEASKVIELRRASTPGRPVEVKVIERLPTTIVLEVKPPAENGGVPVTGYSVEYSIKIPIIEAVIDESSDINETEAPEVSYPTNNLDIEVDESSVENVIRVENLSANTTYQFKVKARNGVGLGQAFELISTTAAFSEPGPVIISSKNMSTHPFEYTLTWESPVTGGRPVRQYKVEYRRVMYNMNTQAVEELSDSSWITKTASANGNHHFTIKNLEANSYYQLKIIAENEIGWSKHGKEFVFSTVKDPDAIPPSTLKEEAPTTVMDSVTTEGGEGGKEEEKEKEGEKREEKEMEKVEGVPGASSQKATVNAGAVVGAVLALVLIFLVVVDISCYFVKNRGVTSFICARMCKSTQSKEKAMEDGESEIVKQPLPGVEAVTSVDEPRAEENYGEKKEQEVRLNKDENDEGFKGPQKVVAGEESRTQTAEASKPM